LKTKILITTIVSSFVIVYSSFGQGTLTPPGAPAATMKSLAQIEPRLPISSAPFTISAPGSYYLTTNLTVSSANAITISANNVTLDLGGFTIASTAPAASGAAIFLGTVTNVAIHNGYISSGVTNSNSGVFGGSGFSYGIADFGSYLFNARVKDVSVEGVLTVGISLGIGTSSVVEACTVNVAGGTGIYADSVSDSTAMNCGSYAINAGTTHNCTGYGVGSGNGINAITANDCLGNSSGGGNGLTANTANNCNGSSSGSGTGLSANTANNCNGSSSTGIGLYGGYSATGCYGNTSSGNYGLYTSTANNCYGNNAGSGAGLVATTANNCSGNNSASGTGLYASAVATSCYGFSSSGTGLNAFIANVCHGVSTTGTAISTSHNVNSY
jgi:hypothetical protein